MTETRGECGVCRRSGVVHPVEFLPWAGTLVEAGWICARCEAQADRTAGRIHRAGAVLWFSGCLATGLGVLVVFGVGFLTIARFLLTGQ